MHPFRNSENNPLDLFEKLIDFAAKHEIVLINDNPYSLILNDNPISILSIRGAEDVAIELNLYPNPVTGKQPTLYINNSKAGVYSLRIYAANGQLIKTGTFRHPGGSYSGTIELPEQLQAGQYFIQAVDSNGQVTVVKFLKQ